MKKTISLTTKATIGLIVISTLSVISLTAIFQTIVHDEILLIEQGVIQTDGNTVVAEIANHLSSVERLVQNMAQLASTLPKDKKTYHKVFPGLLGSDDITAHIAGGGIWPEPFTFNKNVNRRSFFWGRDQKGLLRYYDDYNNPSGKGYQNEEWYVPAKYLNDKVTYWSRSYMDPYSYETMVTATAAYKNKQGKFDGVATVDIKLSGLNKLFKNHAKHSRGYIIAVDRNDALLSFPENEQFKPYQLKNNKPTGQYFTLKHFVDLYPGFSSYFNHLKSKRKEISQNKLNYDIIKKLSTKIERESYQIEQPEAFKIAQDIKLQQKNSTIKNTSIVYIDYDPLLKTNTIASIHYLPKYHWYIIIVTPRYIMKNIVHGVVESILFWTLLIILLIFILIFFIFNKIIMNPLKIMSQSLVKNIDAKNHNPMPVLSNDEIGQLATLFNQYSRAIQQSKIDADKANNAKSEFLSRMSHELRTPLNAIIGFSQILDMEDSIDDEHRDYIQEIHKAGNYLLLLVNDLIDISRIENDIALLKIKPTHLGTVLKDTIKLLEPIQNKFQITIDVNIENCFDYSVSVDNTALKQVFINVITNAIKYNKKNGTITITCENEHSCINVNITDTGLGISIDKIDTIFEPFNRSGKEYSDIEGTGIGLYVTKKLLKDMQAGIAVTSELNVGSTFTIKLPISIIDAQDNVEQTKNHDQPHSNLFNNIKILIVEDIISNQKIIQQQIKHFGYISDLASNGEHAMELLNKEKYDLILTDCTMPVMDGYELTKLIRSHLNPNISKIPIIAITANVMQNVKQQCLDSGMNDYISKPIDIKILKDKIEQQLLQWNADKDRAL